MAPLQSSEASAKAANGDEGVSEVPVPQQLVIERIRERCEELDERYPGYRKDLLSYLAEILSIERAAPHNIVQQVDAQLEAFGDLVHRKSEHEATT